MGVKRGWEKEWGVGEMEWDEFDQNIYLGIYEIIEQLKIFNIANYPVLAFLNLKYMALL